MFSGEVVDHLDRIRESDPLLRGQCGPTTADQKFASLLDGRYDEVVFDWSFSEQEMGEAATREFRRRFEYNRQRALLLLAVDGFRERIMEFAHRWRLDERHCEVHPEHFYFFVWRGGLSVWQDALLRASRAVLHDHRERFLDALQKLARDFTEDLDYRRLSERRQRVLGSLPSERFWLEAKVVARASGLSQVWVRSIAALVLSGKLFVPRANCWVVVRESGHTPRVFVELFPETREEDLVAKWRDTEWLRLAMMPEQKTRRRPRGDLSGALRLRSKLRGGKTLDEILVWDYDLDDGSRDMETLRRDEDRLRERLRKCQVRLEEDIREAGSPLSPATFGDWAQPPSILLGDEEWYY